MTQQAKNRAVVLSAAVFFLVFFIWCLCRPADNASESERRLLAARPPLRGADLLSGKFMEDFESYATDQFPLRDAFRSLKSLTSFYLFRQRDVRGLYLSEGYASKLEYPLKTASLDNAVSKFRAIYDKYLKESGANVYLSVIPDKNSFLAAPAGYPAMDYDFLAGYLQEKADFAEYIDIFDCLELADYYRTDTHWRQERIADAAGRLAEGMGVELSQEYSAVALERPFHGVYHGQLALPLPPEQMYYLENDIFESCTVYDYETEQEIPVYDMAKAAGRDPYELFLGGPKSLLTVRNGAAATDRKLVIFRDSFGSSIAPLLFEGYSEVTLIDIRYLASALLGRFVEFEDCDVLFLYSTLVLNNSETLK